MLNPASTVAVQSSPSPPFHSRSAACSVVQNMVEQATFQHYKPIKAPFVPVYYGNYARSIILQYTHNSSFYQYIHSVTKTHYVYTFVRQYRACVMGLLGLGTVWCTLLYYAYKLLHLVSLVFMPVLYSFYFTCVLSNDNAMFLYSLCQCTSYYVTV